MYEQWTALAPTRHDTTKVCSDLRLDTKVLHLTRQIHAFIDFSMSYKYTRNLSAGPLSSEFDIKYLLCCCHTLLLRQNSHDVCLTYF